MKWPLRVHPSLECAALSLQSIHVSPNNPFVYSHFFFMNSKWHCFPSFVEYEAVHRWLLHEWHKHSTLFIVYGDFQVQTGWTCRAIDLSKHSNEETISSALSALCILYIFYNFQKTFSLGTGGGGVDRCSPTTTWTLIKRPRRLRSLCGQQRRPEVPHQRGPTRHERATLR